MFLLVSFGIVFLSPFGLGHLTPSDDEVSFEKWCRIVCNRVHKDKKRGLSVPLFLEHGD
jgi:hypothetical protein